MPVVAQKDSAMADGETVDPVTALTTFNQSSQVTRKDHSHPAAYALLHVVSEQMYVGSTEDLYHEEA